MSPLRQDWIPASSEREQAVLSAVNQHLAAKHPSRSPARLDDRLDHLGLSSLDLVEVLLILEDLLEREIDPDYPGDLERVADLARMRLL